MPCTASAPEPAHACCTSENADVLNACERVLWCVHDQSIAAKGLDSERAKQIVYRRFVCKSSVAPQSARPTGFCTGVHTCSRKAGPVVFRTSLRCEACPLQFLRMSCSNSGGTGHTAAAHAASLRHRHCQRPRQAAAEPASCVRVVSDGVVYRHAGCKAAVCVRSQTA